VPDSPAPPSPDQNSLDGNADATRLELHRLQRLFRSAFSHQFQFMAILSAQGHVVDYNEQFAVGTRLPRNEVIGVLFWETASWRDQPAIVAAWPSRLQEALGSSAAVVYHDQFKSPDGEWRWAEAAVHALRDEAGRPEGFVVQATDTTEQHRAEAMRDAAEQRLRDAQTLLAIGTLADALADEDAVSGTGFERHVLYLDDDEVIAPLAGQLLLRAGYRVTTHVDSDAALACPRDTASDFDIVVTDFNMPGRNGLDVIRLLKGLAPALPVVLTSGYIDDALRAQAARLGVQHLVNKEDLREQLCRTVGAALREAPFRA